MNGRMAKKVRKYSQRNWMEYFHAIRQWPFGVRLRFCWQVLFGMMLKKKHLSKKKILEARQPVKAEPPPATSDIWP